MFVNRTTTKKFDIILAHALIKVNNNSRKEIVVSSQKLFNDFDKRRDAVKEYAKDKNVPLWKIAADMGINDGNLSRKLRMLSESQEQEMYNRIDRLAEEMEVDE